MSDDAAFMELVLANAQSELTALERGLHALQATEKGSKVGLSVKAYAGDVNRELKTVQREVWAAEVAEAVGPCGPISLPELMGFERHLAEIHAAPVAAWPILVKHLLADDWTVKATQAAVQKVKGIAIPEKWVFFMPVDAVFEAAIGADMTQPTIIFLAAECERIVKEIEALEEAGIGGYMHLALQAKPFVDDFLEWLKHNACKDAWEPAKLKASGKRHCALAAKELDRLKVEARRLDDDAAAIRKAEKDAADALEKARKTATEKLFDAVSLEQWNNLDAAMRSVVLTPAASKDQFNKQKDGEDENSIDWAQYTWNPITGCLHECSYCYARDIATRFEGSTAFPNGFIPTLRANRLNAPGNMKIPKDQDPRARRVFVCSMADLFGRWVPDDWIARVLDIAGNTAGWEFLMLTKFPKRMSEFDIPENVWMGTTVDCQARVANAERAFEKVKAKVKWLSIEPLIEPLKFSRLELFDMIAIGGASKSNNTPKWIPPYSWVHDLMLQANEAKCSVYIKSNLYLKEGPGESRYIMKEIAPQSFHYLRKHGEV